MNQLSLIVFERYDNRKVVVIVQSLSSTKDKRGTPDRRGFLDRTVQPPDQIGLVWGQENGSGRERGSFLSVRVFFFSVRC